MLHICTLCDEGAAALARLSENAVRKNGSLASCSGDYWQLDIPMMSTPLSPARRGACAVAVERPLYYYGENSFVTGKIISACNRGGP